ncbi:PAS domain S-box protein [Methanocalculus sp.]|uniref:PAS domain S-box protein n=1 Tax=Methanocalculus sp. TaxID=2004547 RepID=UPI00271C61E1|nr:PAS domain S-box protein [Methanocalculus sp.]MDO8841115.1 PAS domain S-box protein [Methanocalculus sp.]
MTLKTQIAFERYWPLFAVTITTIMCLALSIAFLTSEGYIIFQHFYYIPIIIACFYYVRQGFLFSTALACSYFLLVITFTRDQLVIQQSLFQVIIFILVALVITTLSQMKREAEMAHRRSEERYHQLVDNAGEGVVVIQDDRFRFVNRRFSEITGYSEEELSKSPVSEIIHPDDQKLIENRLKARQEGIRIEPRYALRLRVKDNSMRWMEVNDVIIEWDDKTALLNLITDITERKAAEEALQLTNKKLHLLSSITRHDIINQLTVLIGNLSIAEEVEEEPEQRILLRKIDQSARTIQRIIEFTRDYERLGIDTPTWHSISGLLEKVNSESTIPVFNNCRGLFVFADPMLERLFHNLLDNTIRHGERATEVQVSWKRDGDTITIIWEDNGAGIPNGMKELIFNRAFGRNTGFGLFLCREILMITGMTIREMGKYGLGARFEITIPSGNFRIEERD